MVDMWTHAATRSGDVCTVILAGELDYDVRDELSRVLADQVSAPGTTAVRVDMAGITFMDSSGISVLIKAYQLAEELGCRLSCVRLSAQARRILEVTGLLSLLAE